MDKEKVIKYMAKHSKGKTKKIEELLKDIKNYLIIMMKEQQFIKIN